MNINRPGPDAEWLATWRSNYYDQRDEADAARNEILDRLEGHADAFTLVDRLVSAHNARADSEAEYAIALLADHFPALAFAIGDSRPTS